MRNEDFDLPNLIPAPRSLPITLIVRSLFGGFLSQFGWLFFSFGMVFVWVFDAGGGVVEAIRFMGGTETVQGEVMASMGTSMSVNERPVYRNDFRFELADGTEYRNISYQTGSFLDAGQSVDIEYLTRNPRVSRIVGLRTTPAGLGVVFVFLFPLIGAVLGSVGLRSGLKMMRLMSQGRLTRGTLLTKEATSTRVNEQPVMKLTFGFEDEYGETHHAVARSHRPERLEDEAMELVIYDPRSPADAAVLDELSCQPRVDPEGRFTATKHGIPTALYLLLPGAGMMALLRYLTTLL